jgi:hypothetical protein
MFYLKTLSEEQLKICRNTISSNTFFMIVGDALDSGKNLSVVRMADGEHSFMVAPDSNDPASPPPNCDKSWLKKYGCEGITNVELKRRLEKAANECTYFAASVSGIDWKNYEVHSLFKERDRYVDNFFPNAWTEKMKIDLFLKAGHVLFIHCNTATADAMQIRAKWGLGVRVTYLKLCDWRQSEEVIEKASKINAPLTVFSAGPASKYIGPVIAETGSIPKVTLDLGAAAEHWLLSSLIGTHKEWDETNMHLKETFESNLASLNVPKKFINL